MSQVESNTAVKPIATPPKPSGVLKVIGVGLGVILLIAIVGAISGNKGNSASRPSQASITSASATPVAGNEVATAAAAIQARQPTETSTPLPTPTVDVASTRKQLDTAWAAGNWPDVISALGALRQADPTATDLKDKLYAAYLNYGKSLLTKGDKKGATEQFTKAQDLDPSRQEAKAELAVLLPTATPLPTQKKSMPSDVAAYLTYMGKQLDNSADSAGTVQTALQLLGKNPSLYYDNQWRTTIVVGLAALDATGQAMQSYEPVPADCKEIDSLMVSMGKDLTAASKDMITALDNRDAATMARATSRIEQASRKMDQVTQLVRALKTKYE